MVNLLIVHYYLQRVFILSLVIYLFWAADCMSDMFVAYIWMFYNKYTFLILTFIVELFTFYLTRLRPYSENILNSISTGYWVII